jgi:hypothetical protein
MGLGPFNNLLLLNTSHHTWKAEEVCSGCSGFCLGSVWFDSKPECQLAWQAFHGFSQSHNIWGHNHFLPYFFQVSVHLSFLAFSVTYSKILIVSDKPHPWRNSGNHRRLIQDSWTVPVLN